jgi:mannan endo-1,4-beta-mannosidase
MRWQAVLGTTLATIAVAGAVAGPARADTQAGTASCTVSYSSPSAWPGGFYGQVSVGLSGFPAGSGWQISFSFTSPQQRIQYFPGEQWSQIGQFVVITNTSQVMPQGSVQLGFIGGYGASNPPPVGFTFNGVACSSGTVL